MVQHLELADGRRLEYLVSGARDGFPLIWIHGTPGSYLTLPSFKAACGRKGVKVVSFSRAGYGGSTRWKGRRVVDIVSDVQALTQYLDITRCFVGGWSGGGAHTLACATRLPSCVAVLCVASGAPYDAEGLDFLAGQGQDNIDEYGAAFKGEEELQKFCEPQRTEMLKADVAGMIEAMSSILPDVDKQVMLKDKEMGQSLVDDIHEALKHNSDGWVDDDMAFIQPWGFGLGEIKVPVLLYQGSEDKMVPYAHGEWLAEHLPRDQLRKHLQQGQGHISIFVGQMENMIDELLEIAGH